MGNPDWSQNERFDDPFQLAIDSEEADRLLSRTLRQYKRDELLKKGLEYEAVIAPVYHQNEAAERKIFRNNFLVYDIPQMPFLVEELSSSFKKAINPISSSNGE